MPQQPGPGQVATPGARLLAVSDLHVGFSENREFVAGIRPTGDDDWLIVAGDVGEFAADIEWALALLSERFATVIWVPGNHELWTHGKEPLRLRGVQRYEHLVGMCRRLGVITPEDSYPIWNGAGGPVVVVPMFLLYDYTFLPDGAQTKDQGLERAHAAGVVSTDEALLHPDPHPSVQAWCADRLASTQRRLDALPDEAATVLVNHFPLVREPTRVLRYPVFAQWCGTVRTADWHRRYNAAAVVYGHLHIPRTTWHDGVPHREVSLGYPREWRRRAAPPAVPLQILPSPESGG
jgi:3',5'-cyclic AMP phosphodiesterase CpdA